MNFKSFIFILLAVFSLTSGAQLKKGKVSDGGGQLVGEEGVAVDKVLEIIEAAKLDLRAFVKAEIQAYKYRKMLVPYKKANLHVYDQPLYEKLYGGTKTMWEVLENTIVEADPNKACYDEAGEEADGSFSVKDKSICINVKKIANELDERIAREKILVLMLHEYSHHILGPEEKEPREYHNNSRKFIRMGEQRSEYRYADYPVRTIWLYLREFIELLEKNDLAGLKKNVFNFNPQSHISKANEISSSATHMSFSGNGLSSNNPRNLEYGARTCYAIHNNEESDEALLQVLHLRNAIWYMMKISNIKNRTCDEYDSVFAGSSSITVAEMMKNMNEDVCSELPNRYENYRFVFGPQGDNFENGRIDKIENNQQLLIKLKALEQYYNDQLRYIRKINSNEKLP